MKQQNNSNERGSSYDRKVRKQWLLDTFGNGEIVFCGFLGCTEVLTYDTLTVDRYPLPGCKGGRYIRGNIRPACWRCNTSDGGKMGSQRKKELNRRRAKSMVSLGSN